MKAQVGLLAQLRMALVMLGLCGATKGATNSSYCESFTAGYATSTDINVTFELVIFWQADV